VSTDRDPPDEDLRIRTAMLGTTSVEVVSQRSASRFVARVRDPATGDILGRARAATREDAEAAALDSAGLRSELHEARASLRRGLAHLNGPNSDKE
jgi:hypothetical protein